MRRVWIVLVLAAVIVPAGCRTPLTPEQVEARKALRSERFLEKNARRVDAERRQSDAERRRPRWYQPGSGPRELAGDRLECTIIARDAAGTAGGTGIAGLIAIKRLKKHRKQLLNDCLFSRGWTYGVPPPVEPEPNPAPYNSKKAEDGWF